MRAESTNAQQMRNRYATDTQQFRAFARRKHRHGGNAAPPQPYNFSTRRPAATEPAVASAH
jgi:hypothetical protein